MKRYVTFFSICLILFLSNQGRAQSINNLRTQTSYVTIQSAVNEASSGDTLAIAAGTYTLTGRLTINKSISVIGQDEATTIIDAGANGTDYGILVSASNVAISNFTIKPPLGPGAFGTSTGGGYAIHVSNTPLIVSNVTITHVTVKDGNRSGIDINGVDHLIINYVTTQNAAYGNGINITGVHGANLSHITTGGNAWGGIAVYVSIPSQANRGSDSIIIDATTCNISEANKIYSQNESGLVNTNVTVIGYDYFIKNSSVAFNGYTWYQDNVANAVTYSNLMNASSPGSYLVQLSTGTLYVGSGMSIQSAINAASAGGIVQILTGTFNESVTINKLLDILGTGIGSTILTKSVLINAGSGSGRAKLRKLSVITTDSPYMVDTRYAILIDGSGGNTGPVTIDSVKAKIYPNLPTVYGAGLLISPENNTIHDVVISHCMFDSSYSHGVYIKNASATSGTVSALQISNSSFNYNDRKIIAEGRSFSGYGLYILAPAASPSLIVDGLTITNSSFNGNYRKGLYIESLKNASFSGVTASGNGEEGVDLNLKYGNYSNISFDNCTLINNSTNGATLNNGIKPDIHSKGRDDVPYNTNPASISNLSITSSVIGYAGFGNNITNSPVFSGSSIQTGVLNYMNSGSINCSSNWWGTAVLSKIQSKISGNVIVVPYYVNSTMTIRNSGLVESVFVDATYTDGNAAGHIFGYDAFNKIQDGIDAAATGGTVNVAAGIFDETININKRIALVGAGSSNTGTILKNSATQGDFTHLPLVAGITYSGYRPNVIISASGMNSNKPLLLKDLQIQPGPNNGYPRPALLFQPGPAGTGYVASYSYVELDNVRAIGDVSGDTPGQADPHILPVSSNTRGITIDGCTNLSHGIIQNCEFSDMTYGMIFYNNGSNPSTVQDIEISNTTFARNSVKGFYAEKLSDATFTDVTVIDNGNINHSPYYWAWNNAGIDITLKYGAYKNLVFNNLTVNGNGIGSYGSAGLTVKARGTGTDDPALLATLDGVTVNGGTFSNNTVGIRFGEVNNPSAPMYWSPPAQSLFNTSPSNISVNNASIYANKHFGISNMLTGILIAGKGNWWGSATGPQNNTLNPSGQGDTLSSNVDFAPWWDRNYIGVAHPWAWSTNSDLHTAINTVSQGDTINFLGSNSGKMNISKNVIVKFATQPVIDSLNVTDGDLVLSSTITVSGNLNLSNGNIVTKDSTKIVLDTSAAIPTETQNGAIIGTVEVVPRSVGTGSLSILGLSIGSGNDNLEKVGIVRKSGDSAAVTISNKPGIAMTWSIEADHQPTSGREVVFSWFPDFDNNVDTTQIYVYRNSGSGWRQYAGPFSVSGIPRQVPVNTNGFSSWTIGSIVSTPLVPRLILNSRHIIFPTVKIGQRKDTIITIANTGNDTLKITSITSPKSYITVHSTVLEVPPGQTMNVTIQFESDSLGTRNSDITIVSNAATSPDVIPMTGFGAGTPGLSLSVRNITFPVMNVGEWKDTVVVITNTGNDTLKITSITSTGSNLSFRPASLTIAPRESKNDTIRFLSDSYGAKNALVSIRSNVVTSPDIITIDGYGVGTPILALNSNTITFPTVLIGQWKDTVVTITNVGDDILEITGITSTRNLFSIRPTILSILPGEMKIDTIRFIPDSIGIRNALIRFVSNTAANLNTIVVQGFGAGTPKLVLNPRTITFPSVKTGQWKDTVVTITNTGNDTLKVTSITSTRSYFSVRPTLLIIPPGQTMNDTIRFIPDSIGVRKAFIRFVSNAATNPDTIALSGNVTITGIVQSGSEIPNSFELFQNYPNPFNPSTTIKFNLPNSGTRYFVTLHVYDMLGRTVATLLSENLPAGSYVRQWNAGHLSSGIYFYRLDARKIIDGQSSSFTQTKELVLIK